MLSHIFKAQAASSPISSLSRGLKMAPKRIVVIGGVAGGATAAARIRRLSEDAEITILERGVDVSFANCGLPYYVGNEIVERSRLLLHTPASLASTLNVDIRTRHTVTLIDRENRSVIARDLSTGSDGANISFSYDNLIIATGSAPIRPPIAGAAVGALANVFVLRTVQDSDALKARTDAVLKLVEQKTGSSAPRAIVLGAGFIGLEVAEQLAKRGLQVTIVEAKASVLPGAMDADMARALESDIHSSGVALRLGVRAKAIEPGPGLDAGAMALKLETGEVLGAEIVVLATGVSPESGLAAAAGLAIQAGSKAILVDGFMRTSDPSIYAVGDVVAAPSLLLGAGTHVWVPLGGPANRQARIAADHIITGNDAPGLGYRGSLGTAIVRAFNTTAGCTGLSQAAATAAGIHATTMTVHGFSHAGYYPGAHPITLKAVYDADSLRLLGAQACGGSEGVDKRLDVIATAIAGGAKATDLVHLELSYAPPFGSARDVVNILGMAIENAAAGLVRPTRVEKLGDLPSGSTVIDVRDAIVASCHPLPVSPGDSLTTLNVPLAELRARLPTLHHDTTYTTVCSKGKLGYFAARTLAQSGFNVTSLAGGLDMLARPSSSADEPHTSVAAAGGATTHTGSGASASASLKASTGTASQTAPPLVIDACGMACPGPILELRAALPRLAPGADMHITASDPGFASDVRAFAGSAGLDVVSVGRDKSGIIAAVLRRPLTAAPVVAALPAAANAQDVAIVVFSGELDKVLAALVIANGATAMGGRATLFFTFWGLFALRRDKSMPDLERQHPPTKDDAHSPGAHADLLQRLMCAMVPSGASHLPLSRMNMGGAGAAMMQRIMASHDLPTVPGLLQSAMRSGRVRFVACTMSMEAMGVAPSTLIPGVELGGVADFLASAAQAKTTLFI